MKTRVLLFALLASPALACGGADPCEVDGRTYRAQAPEGWDGQSPLPVLLHFHGWGRQGVNVIRNDRVAGAASSNGMLLLAPDGLGKSWSFWRSGEDRDVAFSDAVLADAARRWPIDPAGIYISGFSYGAAMAARVACARGDRYAGYLLIAGTLWDQTDADCAPGPLRLWQVHGLRDTVMDLPIQGGDPAYAVALWRRANGPDAAREETTGIFTCRHWSAARGETRLCLHRFGHMIPKDWLSYALPQILAEDGA
jgi:polyhydroxybutyrate depolymerase